MWPTRLMAIISAALVSSCAGTSRSERHDSEAPAEVPPIAAPDGGGPSDAAPGPAPESLEPDAGEPDVEPVADILTLSGELTTSIGLPAEGSLEGAVPFPKRAPGVRLNPRRLNPEGHYATVETVQAIVRAAAVVHREMPSPADCELTVNDLGFAEGGPIPHHGSHQAGRDLDVLFYLLDGEGNPRPAKGVPLDPRGRGTDFADLADPSDDVPVRIDVPRTWRFLQALAEDEGSLIQRAFVAEHIRTLLMDHAVKTKAPRAARELVGNVTCQPGTPHDDHLHLRFFCSAEDLGRGCRDMPPLYPWRRLRLSALGVEPMIGRPGPRRRRAKTVASSQARAEAGAMHWKVTAFLKARESWSEQPHPGRPYCR